ncbi:MAG: glycosyltransferase [Actinomycetia bacterium]|nr:glycosyltransferase [Actinomycetes bacterium]
MRVLVVSHMYPRNETDSLGIFVREQVEALALVADVTVVVGRYGEARKATVVAPGRPRVIEVPLPLRRGLPSAVRIVTAIGPYFREALRVAHESGPYDVVHAHYGVPDGVVGIRLSSALGIPVVVTLHGSDANRQFLVPVLGTVFARWVAQADAIIGVSEAIATGMRHAHPKARHRVLHLPNGYNCADIHVHAERSPRYLLFVGRLSPRKNPDVLLDAFARIAGSTTLSLVFVGDGPMAASLAKQARDLGIADRVRFEGSRAHRALDAYLADAAALVLPSKSEGMPMVINEALASGTPVVASRLPGIEQQVRSDEWGILVIPGDVDDLANALGKAITRHWDYARIAADCGVPSWDDYATQLLAVYCSVIRDSGSTCRTVTVG